MQQAEQPVALAEWDHGPPADAGRGHRAGVRGAGGEPLDQVQRELGDVRAPVLQRGARGGAGRVHARAQGGEPVRERLRAFDAPREPLWGARRADHVDRARVGHIRDEQVDEPLDALPRPRALRDARHRVQQLRLARVHLLAARGTADAGRRERHRELGAAARRLAHVHVRGEPADRRQPEPEPRAVGARLHPAPVVGHDDRQLVGGGGDGHVHPAGIAVDERVDDGVGDRLGHRQREIHHVVCCRAVLLRECTHPAPSQRDAGRLSRQLPVLAGRYRRHRREIL